MQVRAFERYIPITNTTVNLVIRSTEGDSLTVAQEGVKQLFITPTQNIQSVIRENLTTMLFTVCVLPFL